MIIFFCFSSRRRHTRWPRDWSSDVCSSDLSRSVDGHWALVRWPVDSPDAAAVLLETGGSIADVVWTSGGELWFVADPTGIPQAYRWRDSGGGAGGGGGGAQPLTNEPLGARAPAPLADGTLLYAALRARGWELRRVSALEG